MRETAWRVLIYRLPTENASSRARVAAWRDLRRLGALPLQSGAVAAPELNELEVGLSAAADRISVAGGTVYCFRVTELSPPDRERMEREWSALRDQEYAELVEECETKFRKEIEFEIFRANLTAGEAEEIEADLDKIRRWYDRIVTRDCFGAQGRETALTAVERSGSLFDDFLERVYEAEHAAGPRLDPPADVPWGTTTEPNT